MTSPPTGNVHDRLRAFLTEHGAEYRLLHHEPTHTSEESARARGEDVRIGGKALLMKLEEEYRLVVVSAALKVDSHAVRALYNVRRLRFATKEELADLTGLVPGSVPPFGHPVLPFPLTIDTSIRDNDRIAFNAGTLTDSIIMSTDDYIRIAGGEVRPCAVH
jgi:prolyl-tRNA editing enzyme YbaK/EbsC (Cys-tRNA(Pro) deacylase)